MHKFSRSLLLAGVLAFGTLTAACGDKVTVAGEPTGVQSVTVTPPAATIIVGESITLAASVTADAATAKTVTWSTSNAATATVDATGKVTGVKAGNVTITATSTADPSKAAASAVTVQGGPVVITPSIAINSVTQGGAPVNLGATAGQIDVTVNTSGGGLIEAFLSTSCTTTTIAAGEVAVASQTATSAQPGTITLSFNTAQLTTANAPRFPNGAYCIKARLTNGTTVVVATNTVPLTLANVNTATATLAFVSQTGGPTSGVSSINGLNYNQGTLTITITPVVFTTSSPLAFISGSFTRSGEQAGGGSPGLVTFVNAPVVAGKVTIVLADTLGAAAGTSIYQYTSTAAGDNLTITSATDAAGNPVTLAVSVTGAQGVRIDNDIPLNAGATYIVNAPNGYVGAAYSFASGTGGTAATDTRGGVPGVGGVTTTYWVGAASATGFATANSCDVTGLTAAALGSDLANTQVTTADAAKVIVADALGNKVCQDVQVLTISGLVATFGVDKIAPVATATTANSGVADKTGYTVGSNKNFSFIYNDSGSAGFSATQPLSGTLIRNYFSAVIATAADCQLGTYNATAKTCVAAPITITNTFGVPPNAGGSIQMTNGTAGAALSSAYYTATVFPVDQAGNVGATVTRIAAYDTIAPVVAAPAPTPNPVAPLATVTLTGAATDNLDLATAKGNLVYAPNAPAPIAGPAATSFGTLFDSPTVTSASAVAVIGNVYRGLQSTTAGVIQANAVLPFGTLTVTDVGTNSFTSAASAIPTTTASTNILQSTAVTLAVTPTSGAPATTQATTTLTVNLSGDAADIPFQSQVFSQLDVYTLTGGQLVKVATKAIATVTDYTTTTTNAGTVRVYTYVLTSVPLTAATTNNLYVVGVTAAGDAVISPVAAVVNP
jgi:hypothetical protein